MRVVVCAVGGSREPWLLPASELVHREWIHGGVRTLYEFAAAAASLGHDVELRGEIARLGLEEICRAAGAWPRVELDPRTPTADDFVVLPEAETAQVYARVALSPARRAVMVLGPPGLFGPPLHPGFSPPDPLTVDLDLLARPEHFRALAALGFELWTNAAGLANEAQAAGVGCAFVGTGQPVPWPQLGPKTHDVAFVAANRWAPLARQVAGQVRGSCLEIGQGDRLSILKGLSEARILILPARIEGQSRLQLEARSMGAVPVALRSNRFAEGMDDAGGAVVVESLEEMPKAIHRLLDSPDELQARADRAVRTARGQAEWMAYRSRVDAVLNAEPPPQGAVEALAPLGEPLDRLGRTLEEIRDERGKLEAGIRWLQGRLRQSEDRERASITEIEWLREVLRRTEAERDAAAQDSRDLRRRRSVRIALRAAGLFERRSSGAGGEASEPDPPV
jgi:hypothetical protein